MTGNCGPESEQLVASAQGAEHATSTTERGEGGCHGMKDFSDPNGPLVDPSRIPSAAGRGAGSISGFRAAADECTVIDSGELGLRVQ